jgi:Polyketide cyclase / dehydrase and lipid transport
MPSGEGNHMSEVRVADQTRVKAPLEVVWLALKDPVAHARWHPFVTDITGEHELDQVRACAVLVGTKPALTRERCVEHDDHRRIIWAIEEDSSGFSRMVSDWRAGFILAPNGETTLVTAESSFRPNNLIVRAIMPMIRRKFHRAQRAILAGLKDSIESSRCGVDLSAPCNAR